MNSIPSPSLEQVSIIEAIRQNNQNILVNSVAGSGKTTLALHIARLNPTKKVLLITFNSRLKDETRLKVEALSLRNMEVHSYHALGYKYYSSCCAEDGGMREVLETDSQPVKVIPSYNIIIIDEAQDMRKLFYSFVHKVIRDMISLETPTLVIVGDENQCLYRFMQADSRLASILSLPNCEYLTFDIATR